MSFLLSVGILFQGCDSDVQCRNDSGNEVDWLVEILSCGTKCFYLGLTDISIYQPTADISVYIGIGIFVL